MKETLLKLCLAVAGFLFLAGCENGGATEIKPSEVNVNTNAAKAEPAKASNSAGKTDEGKSNEKKEIALLAGGCFWGMEEILRKIPGVLNTTVGYTGGSATKPTYQQICTGTTGHAEAVQIEFDPAKITYEEILGYFFRMHDPTTLNRQHNDIGTQYRSAIFYQTEEQKKTAETVKAKVQKSGKWEKPIVTEVTKAGPFYPAETYHQKYLLKNPGGYNCHFLRD